MGGYEVIETLADVTVGRGMRSTFGPITKSTVGPTEVRIELRQPAPNFAHLAFPPGNWMRPAVAATRSTADEAPDRTEIALRDSSFISTLK